jgi:hypothetical protein
MGQTKKIPAEAVELYTRYIHGEISRRDFFNGAQRFAVAGLTATAIVEADRESAVAVTIVDAYQKVA